MKRSFSLSQRIAFGYFFIVVLTGLAGIFTLKQVMKIKKNDQVISDFLVPELIQLQQLEFLHQETCNLMQNQMQQTGQGVLPMLDKIYNEKCPPIKNSLRRLLAAHGAPDVKARMEEWLKAMSQLQVIQYNVVSIRASENSGQGGNILISVPIRDTEEKQMMLLQKQLTGDLNFAVKCQSDYLSFWNSESKAAGKRLVLTIIILLMAVISAGLVISFITIRQIRKPINYLKKTILAMSKGEIPDLFLSKRTDEVGVINNAFYELTESLKKKAAFAAETGKGNYNAPFTLLSSQDELGKALFDMNQSLRLKSEEVKKESWHKSGIAQMSDILRNEHSNTGVLYTNIVSFLSRYLIMNQGALYLVKEDRDKNKYLEMVSCFACERNKSLNKRIAINEGYIGQVAAEKKPLILKDIPSGFFRITSGIGEALPKNSIMVPLLFENELKGVIELASFMEINDMQIELLDKLSVIIAATFDLIDRKMNTELLLFESQELNDKLMEREEALRKSNDNLLEKGNQLKISEEELREQQEELMQTNTQLEEKAQQLAEQNEEIRLKNDQLESAKEALGLKAEQLENTSRYKSEFLANMSHELRTPLNSILILANLLYENKDKNLNDKQVEYARVVKRSGADLLNLINDILDLSKIESRNIELEIEKIKLSEIGMDMNSLFSELAKEKQVTFHVRYEEGLTREINTDKMRVEQILKNLLSNAFKFTDKNGTVELLFEKVSDNQVFNNTHIDASVKMLKISVRDTGIGIPLEKQQLIFEAFKQADGSTSRKYGGTGLGLSISKELSILLGGEIQITSKQGEGSVFTLFLPVAAENTASSESVSNKTSPEAMPALVTSADQPGTEVQEPANQPVDLRKADRMVLIIEDDEDYARILLNHATEKGFTGMIASRGDTGLINAKRFRPDAILLDLNLPGMDGWSVMRRLKEDPDLKHIPVHILSGMDAEKKMFPAGAVEVLKKPVTQEQLGVIFENLGKEMNRKFKKILVIEDNAAQNESIKALLESSETECISALSGREASEKMMQEQFDLITLDLSLPDTSGLQLLKQIKNLEAYKDIPVIIYTGKNLSLEESRELTKYSDCIIAKTERSFERLLDETNLFLNKLDEGNPKSEKAMLKSSSPVSVGGKDTGKPEHMDGKKVLLVDDDIRNIFAMTSILEQQNCKILVAQDGREAINMLESNTDTDIVLMDIMMPEMDGYEAMKQIRLKGTFNHLPIVALTAKAMKGDKEKCLDAGANDYISKPVDPVKLLSVMKTLLYQ